MRSAHHAHAPLPAPDPKPHYTGGLAKGAGRVQRPFPAYRGDQPYVFVCYSHEDSAVVFPELELLRGFGANVYYDEGIAPGHEWTQELADAIDGAAHLLFFVTPASVRSRHCRNEVQYALDRLKPVVAIHLQPTELTGGLKLSLGSAQAIIKYDLSAAEYRAKMRRVLGWPESMEGASPEQRIRRDAAEPGSGHLAAATGVGRSLKLLLLLSLVGALGVAAWQVLRMAPVVAVPDLSLSVETFSAIGADASAAQASSALAEEIRTQVSDYQELRLVAVPGMEGVRTPAAASYVVGGSVQELAEGLRVRAHLTRADDHVMVWSKSFEMPPGIERSHLDEVAQTIARFARFQLAQDRQCETVRRTSRSSEAADAYCAALAQRYLLSQGGDIDLDLELRHAQQARTLDPGIVDAHRIAATNYIVRGMSGLTDWRAAADLAREALDSGLARAPDDPMLLSEQGRLGALLLDWSAAEAGYNASLARDPLHPQAYGNYVGLGLAAIAQGRITEALDLYRRALRINDSDANTYTLYAAALWVAGRHEEAIEISDIGLTLVDSGWARSYLLGVKSIALHALGDVAGARRSLDDMLTTMGSDWGITAAITAVVGRTDEARKLIQELESRTPRPIEPLAMAYVALNDERVFSLLHEAIDRHLSGVVTVLRSNPTFNEEREDPRWSEIMAHLEAEEAGGSPRPTDPRLSD